MSGMTLRPATYRLDEELLDAMAFVAERDGIPITEQVRRGIRLWLKTKGVEPKGKPKARPSKRSS